MYLLRKQLSEEECKNQENLEIFAKFLCLFYAKSWFESTNASDAPANDLQFYKSMITFKNIHKGAAEESIKKIKRHTWYLTAENVVMCLFSDKLSDNEKSTVALLLLKYEKPEEFCEGKPKQVTITENTNLKDLISENSYFIFSLIDAETDWLQNHPSTWAKNADYLKVYNYVKKLKVANDTAERAIKLITEYSKILTNDDTQREYIIQLVEHHRKQYADTNKKTINTP